MLINYANLAYVWTCYVTHAEQVSLVVVWHSWSRRSLTWRRRRWPTSRGSWWARPRPASGRWMRCSRKTSSSINKPKPVRAAYRASHVTLQANSANYPCFCFCDLAVSPFKSFQIYVRVRALVNMKLGRIRCPGIVRTIAPISRFVALKSQLQQSLKTQRSRLKTSSNNELRTGYVI